MQISRDIPPFTRVFLAFFTTTGEPECTVIFDAVIMLCYLYMCFVDILLIQPFMKQYLSGVPLHFDFLNK